MFDHESVGRHGLEWARKKLELPSSRSVLTCGIGFNKRVNVTKGNVPCDMQFIG
jgi:hypothetical protein